MFQVGSSVGVAVTDATGTVIREVEIIRRQKEKALRRTCARIEEIIDSEKAEFIVIGLPLRVSRPSSSRDWKD